ncbi:hypothetical protein SLU01_01390 [Sporosarcina luteola]|uniref:Uncharacterized protein n=1 Tax=Sporosarcina luteola TaxID=582850 RepID=A0A511Z344_9BACL|nr:hypothetical protein SLU01_01390 [Sporosarcina luteola]
MANQKRGWHPNGFYHRHCPGQQPKNIFNTNREMNEYFRIPNTGIPKPESITLESF